MKFWNFFFVALICCLAFIPSVYAQEATETEVEVPQTNEEDDQEFEAFKIEEPEEEEETQTDEGYDELEEVPIKISTLPIHPLTDIPEPASDIEVTYKFVDGEESFPIGEGINVLIHLRNNGNNLYNITNAMGSLNSASNFGIYYQNFTEKNFNTTLYPNYELTLHYVYGIYNLMDPKDYQMALTLFYETESDNYATTFFNQTVTVVDRSSIFDIETIGMIASFVAIIVGSIYLFTNSASSKK